MSNLFPPESFVVPREVLHRRLCQGEGIRRTDVVVDDGLYDTLRDLSLDSRIESVRVRCLRVLNAESENTCPGSVNLSKYCLEQGLDSRRVVPQSLANAFFRFSPGPGTTEREQEVRGRVAGFLRDVILQSRGGKKTPRGYLYEWLLNSGETNMDITIDDLRSLGIVLRHKGDPNADFTLSRWIEACGEDLTRLLIGEPGFANKRVLVELEWKIASEGCFRLMLKLKNVAGRLSARSDG